MADDERFSADRTLERIRGVGFRGALAGATLIGVVSLVILVAYVLADAVRPATGDLGWYVVWAATAVVPTIAYWGYVRREPHRAAVGLRTLGATVGGAAMGLVVLVTVRAVSPYDVVLFGVAAAVPGAAVIGYGRRVRDAAWTGPATPVAIIAGLGTGALAYDIVRPFVGILADWVAFLLVVGVPVGVATWLVARERLGERRALLLGIGGILVPGIAGIGGLFGSYDPSVGVVLAATIVVPTILVVADTLRPPRRGSAGLLVPVVAIAGAGLAMLVTGTLGFQAPDSWFTPTLFTDSFSTISPERAGYYPQIVGSILLVGLMAILVFPVGVAAAIYLEEYAPSTGWGGRLTKLVQINISNLAGVPSVVYGLLGLGLFMKLLGLTRGVLIAASATLGLLILPIVIVSAQEAIRAVPESRRQAAYGMGASRWQTVRDIVLPEAIPGILTGTILALGRAIGETAPILIVGVATSATSPPDGLFAKATALPLQIFAARAEPDPAYRYGVLAAGVVVLLALMLSMNAVAIVLRNRYQRG